MPSGDTSKLPPDGGVIVNESPTLRFAAIAATGNGAEVVLLVTPPNESPDGDTVSDG